MTTLEMFLYSWAASSLVMLFLWLWQFKTENAGIVDVGWAFLTPLVGCWLVMMSSHELDTRQLLILFMGLFWGFRLGIYIFRRVINEIEDGRYRHMRNCSGKHPQLVMFIFFQVQATWTLLFALPFWAAALSPRTTLDIYDFLGIGIWIIAITGEVICDRQLHAFRSDKNNKGQVCNTGLWKYSRHPNYFFEWMQWWAFVFIGVGSPYWWLTWSGLLVMYVFITKITGIPYTEQQATRSRGDAYRKYQQTTSAFFPLPQILTVRNKYPG